MRVRPSPRDRRRTLDEENPSYSRADHPHAAPGVFVKLAAGSSLEQVARELGISEATFHRWKARYGAMNPQEAKNASRSWRKRTPA
jgi:AraC-like DNA-binding protein